jgi:hypothetical protein
MFTWKVVLLDEQTGEKVEKRFSARWSPRKDYVTNGGIAVACAAQETVVQRRRFLPISASLIES